MTRKSDTYSYIYSFLYRSIIFSYMKMNGIHENDGIFLLQRAILPFFGNWKNAICHVRNHLCRCIHPIDIRKVCWYVSGSHSLCIHGQNLIFNVRNICLMFFYNLWFKFTSAITGDIKINIAHRRCNRFMAVTVPAIICLLILIIILRIAKFLIHFCF